MKETMAVGNDKVEKRKLTKPDKANSKARDMVVLYGMEGGSNNGNCNCVAGCQLMTNGLTLK